MSVNGIGATGYPITGYETRKKEQNVAGESFAKQAAPVEDGQKIIIPRKGETKGEYITEESGIKEDVTTKNNQARSQTQTINLNKATKEELQTLQGIGEATAQKIIQYREENRKI